MNLTELGKRIDEEMLLEKRLYDLDDDTVLMTTMVTEYRIRKTHPHARLLFITDVRGSRRYVGVYDAPLELTCKRQFVSRFQHAAQLIGKEHNYSEEWSEKVTMRIICRAWADAWFELQVLRGQGSFKPSTPKAQTFNKEQ